MVPSGEMELRILGDLGREMLRVAGRFVWGENICIKNKDSVFGLRFGLGLGFGLVYCNPMFCI